MCQCTIIWQKPQKERVLLVTAPFTTGGLFRRRYSYHSMILQVCSLLMNCASARASALYLNCGFPLMMTELFGGPVIMTDPTKSGLPVLVEKLMSEVPE